MEHGDQIEAIAPVFLEIGIQDCGMSQVAVHDSPGYRRRAADPEALPLRKVPVLPASAKHGAFRGPGHRSDRSNSVFYHSMKLS